MMRERRYDYDNYPTLSENYLEREEREKKLKQQQKHKATCLQNRLNRKRKNRK